MIVAPAYVRRQWLPQVPESLDDVISEKILLAQSDVEGIIRQPLESRVTEYFFEGNGRKTVACPYTLLPILTSVSIQNSDTGAWTIVTGSSLSEGAIRLPDATVKGARYKASLSVGLPAIEDDDIKSVAFTNPRYGKLLRAVCEFTVQHMTETPHGGTGENRFNVTSAAKGMAGGMTTTTTFKQIEGRWRDELREFTKLTLF